MRTDTMQFFSGGSGNRPAKMDCTGSRKQPEASAGSETGKSKSERSASFAQALKEVAHENVAAEKASAPMIHKKQSSKQTDGLLTANKQSTADPVELEVDEEAAASAMVAAVQGGIVQGDEVLLPEYLLSGNEFMVDEEVALQAETMVKDALAVISETLGISLMQDPSQFSLKQINDDVKAQFAEIVFVLKKLVEGFNVSKENNVPVELPKKTVDPSELDGITSTLRMCAFKIEMACQVIGISEEVQKEVAVKLEIVGAGSLLQATDPKSLMMAKQDTEKLFAGMFTDVSEADGEVSTLISKVKKLLSGASGAMSVTSESTVATEKPADLKQLDTMVYRALLKIDKLREIGTQNETAATQGDKVPVPESLDAMLAVSGDPISAEEVDQNVVGEIKQGAPAILAAGQAKIPAALMKMTEESVMQQVTEKLNSVVRSGLNEVRVQLRPESLGEVTMRIRMEGDVVIAKIEVQNQQVKEIMDRNLSSLKDALAQHNITAGSFDVVVNNGNSRHQGGFGQNPWMDQEFAQDGKSARQDKDDDHKNSGGTAAVNKPEPAETGRRYGNNSVEFFA